MEIDLLKGAFTAKSLSKEAFTASSKEDCVKRSCKCLCFEIYRGFYSGKTNIERGFYSEKRPIERLL